MKERTLTGLDPQLAYLVLLTRYGLKPLSRWEGRLDDRQHNLIGSAGLELEPITRRTRIGRKIRQTVFARNARAVRLYRDRFQDTPLRQTPDEIRKEGWFFGYPSCCVDAFIKRPYVPNRLAPEDQQILFHWACPDCVVTPGLLREYRRIHRECEHLFRGVRPIELRPRFNPIPRRLLPVAASLALAAGSVAIASNQPPSFDPHWLAAPDDVDGDYLSVAEEIVGGTIWDNADTNGDLVLDGVEMSYKIWQLIMSPPPGILVEYHFIMDYEPCLVCGIPVDMGLVRIIHTARGLQHDLHFITLHFLEHGCLQYAGGLHQGRVDLDPVKRILFACDTAHLLPPEGLDPDQDGLLSEEEPPLGTDPIDPDTDKDSLADGPQIAEQLLPILADLPRNPDGVTDTPYMREAWVDGLETCEVCGVILNMGHVDIINPAEGLSLSVPFVGLHTMAHGGFVYNGTYNEGRVLPVLLRTVLNGDGIAHWLAVAGDGDTDGLTNEEEQCLGMDPANPDENGNLIPDGRELATRMATEIGALPEGPLPDRVYVIHHLTFGHYNCLLCGEPSNMGFAEIVNPMTGASAFVPYYNLHFMDHGSYSTDRTDLYPRVDPEGISRVLWGAVPQSVSDPSALDRWGLWCAPNPSSTAGGTQIRLSLSGYQGKTDVTVFDAAGRKIRGLHAGQMNSGILGLAWDGRDEEGRLVPPGVYFCKAELGTLVLSRRIVLTP